MYFLGNKLCYQIGNISCIVYDTDNMCMFGYITSDIDNLQRFSHVFSAESKEKASEILSAICQGYREGVGKAGQGKEAGNTGTQKRASGHRQKGAKEVTEKKVRTQNHS